MNNLINDIDGLDINNFEFDKNMGKIFSDIFSKYNNGKIKKIGYIFWSNIENEISKLSYNKDIFGVYIKYIDRGVGDWKKLDELLRHKFPNLKSICVFQNFGKDNLALSLCDLIIMCTNSEYDIDNCTSIYKKEITGCDYFCPERYVIDIVKVENQIQIIINDEDISGANFDKISKKEIDILSSGCIKYGLNLDIIINKFIEIRKNMDNSQKQLVMFSYGPRCGCGSCFYGIFQLNNLQCRVDFV